MPLDPVRLFKPIRKTRKLIKKLPKTPSPEQVHDLRTSCRKLESILHALRFDEKNRGRKLLNSVKPIRRSAGKVRDMDVLTGLITSMPQAEKNESCVQLLEYLGTRRSKQAKKLSGIVASEGERALSSLKQLETYLKQQFERPREKHPSLVDPASVSLEQSASLATWPRIDRQSLHPYRLKVKELRYVLELAANPEQPLIEALGEVKDSIGQWHDWCELEQIAADVIGDDRETRKQIHSIAEGKFSHAMTAATRLHAKYFGSDNVRGRKRHSGPVPLKNPVLNAAAKMAA